MATPVEVIDLFADVREGSSFERARAAANAFRAFGSLGASEKRDLAVLVAERAAPQLVPKIQAETGLDLTREQVQAVIDMAGRMDADDIEELRHVATDQQAREQTLRTVGASAASAAAGASGLDDVIATPAEDEHAPAVAADDTTDAPDVPASPESDRPGLDVDASELEDLGVESALLELDPAPEPSTPVAPAPAPREFASVFADLPSLPALEQRVEGGTTTPARVGVTLADVDAAPETMDLTTRVRATQHPLVELLREQTTGAGCVRAVRAHVDDLADMDAVGRTAVVDAVPDGWARRRALQAMLDAHVVPAHDVADLLRRVTSPVARAWLCASAIEADMLRADQLDDLLPPRAATRLRGRYR